jgi:hypothetical protein
MSQATDYTVDNSTGANVRADINAIFGAISTNNSGGSDNGSVGNLGFFANTSTSTLQLKNAAGSAFINLRGFDGTLPLPDGSVSSPSLFFDDDTNTGLFSSAADTFNVATGGVERMELGATTIFNESGADVDFRIEGDTDANLFYVDAGNNRIGIGTSSPNKKLKIDTGTASDGLNISSDELSLTLAVNNTGDSFARTASLSVSRADSGTLPSILLAGQGGIQFAADINNERMRVDTNGSLMVGGTSTIGANYRLQAFHATDCRMALVNTTAASSQEVNLQFLPANSVTGAMLTCTSEEDFSTTANRTARLAFSTRKDGTLAERMRITSDGNIGIGTTSPDQKLVVSDTSSVSLIRVTANNAQEAGIDFGDTDDNDIGRIRYSNSGNLMKFFVNAAERIRIDSSGRLLLGHSSARPVAGNTNRMFQIEGTTSDIAGVSIVRNAASSGGPFISFGKSRSNSVGSNTIVQDGDTLGTISFAGTDGTNLESRGADIFAQVDGTPGVDDMPGRLIFSTTPDGSVSPSERMRIDSAGRTLINTANVGGTFGAALQVKGIASVTDFSIALIDNSNSVAGRFHLDSTGAKSITIAADPDNGGGSSHLAFAIDGSEKGRFDSSGNFLVGTTDTTLSNESGGDGDVGTVISKSSGFQTKAINHHTAELNRAGTQGGTVLFFHDGTEVGNIAVTSSATSYNSGSDYRLKENVVAISDGITRLKTLKPSRFNFKTDPSTTLDGFLAHEVTAVPEAITGTKDAVVTQALINAGEYKQEALNNPIYQGIDQSKLVPLLVAAVQELIIKVETLEAA